LISNLAPLHKLWFVRANLQSFCCSGYRHLFKNVTVQTRPLFLPRN
jgi:hypothetical protein